MRNIVEQYSPDNNFWEVNPQFTAINPFKKIWAPDKSRGKKVSSDLMWAIALLNHPKSDLYYIPNKEEKITVDFLKIKKSEVDSFWEENKYLVDAFKDAVLTQADRSLLAWETFMKERDEFLEQQKYTFGYINEDGIEFKDNVKSLDEMRARTAKMYSEYFQIKKEVEEEDVKNSSNKKGYSSSEAGI